MGITRDQADCFSRAGTHRLNIKLNEVFVRPVLPMVFRQKFRQFFWQIFQLARGSFTFSTSSVITDSKSRAAYSAEFIRVQPERCGAQQFLVKYSHGDMYFIGKISFGWHGIPLPGFHDKADTGVS